LGREREAENEKKQAVKEKQEAVKEKEAAVKEKDKAVKEKEEGEGGDAGKSEKGGKDGGGGDEKKKEKSVVDDNDSGKDTNKDAEKESGDVAEKKEEKSAVDDKDSEKDTKKDAEKDSDKDSDKDGDKKEKKEKKLAVDDSGDDSGDSAEDGGEDGAESGSERRAGGDDDAKAKEEKAKDDEADKEDDKEEKKEQEDKEKKEDDKVKKGKKKQEEGKQEPDQKEDDDSSRALDSNDSSDKSDKKDSKTDDADANADANNGDGTEPDRALDAKNKKAEKDKTKAKDKKAENDEKKEEKAIEKEKKTQPDEPDRFLDEISKTKAEKTGNDSNSNSPKKQSEQSRQAELRDLNSNPLIDADTVSRNLTRFKQRAEQLSQTTQTDPSESDEDKRFLKLDHYAQLEAESQLEEDNSSRRLTTTKSPHKPDILRRLTPIKYLDAGDYSTSHHRRLSKTHSSIPQEIQQQDSKVSKTDKEERNLINDFRSNHSFGSGSDSDHLMDALNEDFDNKKVTVPMRNDFKTEEDYRRLLLVRSQAKEDDTLEPAEGGEAKGDGDRALGRKRMNRILGDRGVVGRGREARRLHKEIIEVARFERRLTKKINLLVKRSKDAGRDYRKLQEMKNTPVKFAVKKDLTESLSSVLDKPKGIKETKVTRNSVESRNPVQRMKRLIPTDAARKGGELLRWANLGVMMIALWLTV
jgi:hypothetical protein